ncbi:serine/threonine protein kinase [Archangium sp.]|uniref:serine/threonine protein kinase n=1 Tax=Archangium sp. TaxID=1872627 RepID=UPI00389B2D85
MSEAGAMGPMEEREGERHGSPEEHLPRVGMEVAGYRLERRVGRGGQGTVFRASREGRGFAVKFIFLPRSARWGWRELDVLVKLWPAGGPLLEGCGLWPAQQPRFLFLVTPYVHGLPLDTWTRLHNPTALQVARLVLQAARQLQPVHKAGVVHRDVKGANLLVDEEERLVLVDFGVATYAGAPAVTGPFPPGSWCYLSPRVWRAWRGEEQSRDCPGDDVWSLGVELYQSLTGRLPFRGREEVLVQAILHEEPEAPHEANPRVPRVLGELCLRMLRKQPGERFADAWALETALEEVLKGADAAWEVPLGEPWGPHLATTVGQQGNPPLTGGEWEALHERLASYEQRLVRGRPLPPDEASPEPGPPGSEPAAPAVAGVPPSAPVPTARSRGLHALGVLAVVGGLGLCVGLAVVLLARGGGQPTLPVGTPRADPRLESSPTGLEPGGQEVAPPGKRPEGDGGAAPSGAPTPAPVAPATHSEDTRVKTPASSPAAPPSQPPKKTGSPVHKLKALTLGCTLATGCAGATPTAAPVRSLPGPAECPPGAVDTMKALGLFPGKARLAVWPRVNRGDIASNYVTVREGPVDSLRIDQTDTKLPPDTQLSGVLFFGEGRVHGRFTQVHTPGGDTYPVCIVLGGTTRRFRGVVPEPPLGGFFSDGTARIGWSQYVAPVERFE